MVDYKKLKILREKTGVSLSLCKRALEESNNNLDEAMKKITKWGVKASQEKGQKATTQGGIFNYTHHNNKVASMIELQSETDFVSTNSEFQNLGKELAMQVASIPAKDNKELLKQEYIRDPNKTIKDLIDEAILKFGENIKINRFIRWQLDQ